MNSCAASCCTCFPKAWCASATLASWPTGDAPLCFRFVFNCSGLRHSNRRLITTPLTRTIFGAAPCVAERWWSSKDSLLPRSNFVLPPPCSLRLHETTLYHKKSLRVSAHSVSLRLAVPQTAPFYFLRPGLRQSLALSSPFPLPLSSIVLCRTASAHLDTALSLN